MRNTHTTHPTSATPVWVSDPYNAGQSINVEPLFAYLSKAECTPADIAERLDTLTFFFIESVDIATIGDEPMIFKNSVNLAYQLRNVFSQIGNDSRQPCPDQ